jgi:hypothetical protein
MNKQFNTPLTPISWGELIDKVTILEIKLANIASSQALLNVRKELSYLNAIISNNFEIENLIKDAKKELFEVNLSLWKVEDEIREKELKQQFDQQFITLARSVYRLNDQRAKLKKVINANLKSELVEEKSYKNFQVEDEINKTI